jgi:hypothetical protein
MLVPAVASPTRRRVLRGSAVGLGLLVSVAVVAPPALAAPLSGSAGALVADFEVSGTLEVHLAAAPIPEDLDLSGARFEIVDVDGVLRASCETDVYGKCSVAAADGLAAGNYSLRQDATRRVAGLVPSTAVRTFTVSPCMVDGGCPTVSKGITDFSLFRTGLTVTVRDGSTHAPLAGASYSLTGPDYRHRPPVLQQDQATTFPQPSGAEISGTVVSSSDGRLAYGGFFLDGEWALTPEVTPPGYRSSGVLPVTLPARTGDPEEAWTSTVDLAPDAVTVTGTGGGGAVLPPALPPALRPASTPSGAPVPTRATAVPPGEPASSPAAAAVPTSAAVPSFSAPMPFVDEGDSRSPSAADAATGDPQLRAAASASLLDVGLIGVGVLFVTIVVLGVGYVRRRVRR